MHIGIVWHGIYPWDIRIEKFSQALSAAGHEVTVISRSGGKIAAPLFFNPHWIRTVGRAVREKKIDLLIVRDLPLAVTVAYVARRAGIPAILDMAENYPAALCAYGSRKYRLLVWNRAWPVRQYELLSLRLVDRTIVVAEEQRDRLVRLGYPPERIGIVRNTPEYDTLRLQGTRFSTRNTVPQPYLLYSGFIDRHRGIPTLIRGFYRAGQQFPRLRLVLIGSGNDLEACRKLAAELKIASKVLFTGWLDSQAIPAYIRGSAACVVPHLKSEHTETTIPNKIFDYLCFGKPVIVSDIGPLKRIVAEAGGGMVFRSGDHDDLARAIVTVMRQYRTLSGEASRELIRTKYNWTNDRAVLRDLVDAVAAHRTAGGRTNDQNTGADYR